MAQIVTITNPLTGQPAKVDQLDHTAQEIDDAISRALPGGYYDKWVSQLPGMNLLDNWYFGNPVDQRQGRVVKPNTTYYSDNTLATSAGTTSAYVKAYRYATGTVNGVNYASFKLTDSDTAPTYYAAPENVVRGYTGAGYTIDRWILQAVTSCSMLVGDGYITLYEKNNDGLLQKFPAEQFSIGDTITVSVLTDTELLSKTITLTESVQAYPYDNSIWNMAAGKSNGIWYVWPLIVYNQSTEHAINIKAIKLELGSQQTLAHQDENGNWVLNDPPPDKGMELWKCRQHFRIIQGATYLNGIRGYSTNTDIEVPIPGGPMRAAPTPILKGTSNIVATDGTSVVTVSSAKSAKKDFFVLTADSGLSVRGPVAIYCNDTIWLDANL